MKRAHELAVQRFGRSAVPVILFTGSVVKRGKVYGKIDFLVYENIQKRRESGWTKFKNMPRNKLARSVSFQIHISRIQHVSNRLKTNSVEIQVVVFLKN